MPYPLACRTGSGIELSLALMLEQTTLGVLCITEVASNEKEAQLSHYSLIKWPENEK